MTAPRDTDTRIGAFLDEGPAEMSPRLIAAIRDEVQATHRRAFRRPWRTPPMFRALTVMATVAALAVAGVLLFDEDDRSQRVASSPPAPAIAAASPALPTPSPSPSRPPVTDGEEWIAFLGRDEFVELVRPDGSGRHRVLSSTDFGQGAPDWSPDGRQLVFDRYDGSAKNLWITNADGTGGRALTPETPRCGPCLMQGWARWSPDGRSIAFINSEVDTARTLRNDLAIVDVETGAVRTLLSSETQRFEAPSWSPDGNRIVLSVVTYRMLATADREGNEPLSTNLAVVDVGSAEPDLVPIPGLPSQPGLPAWSPDGTRIAFVDAESAISSVSPEGGDVVELFRAPPGSVLETPSWTPDGLGILHAFLATTDAVPVLRVLDPATGRVMAAAGQADTDGWAPRMRPTP